MFSLFPSDWSAPKKPKWMGEKPEPRKAVRLSSNPHVVLPPAVPRNAPAYVPVQEEKPCPFPTEEMLRPDEDVDLTEINRMLASIGMIQEADQRGEQVSFSADDVQAMIRDINSRLQGHIRKLKEAQPWEEPMGREEMIEVLEMFVRYSNTLEEYFRKREGGAQ